MTSFYHFCFLHMCHRMIILTDKYLPKLSCSQLWSSFNQFLWTCSCRLWSWVHKVPRSYLVIVGFIIKYVTVDAIKNLGFFPAQIFSSTLIEYGYILVSVHMFLHSFHTQPDKTIVQCKPTCIKFRSKDTLKKACFCKNFTDVFLKDLKGVSQKQLLNFYVWPAKL